MTYDEISKLPVQAYLDPYKFVIKHDSLAINKDYDKKQYEYGLEVSQKAKEINILADGSWSAEMMNGHRIISHEVIGYHSCTSALLRGLLEGPASIIVHRANIDKPIMIKKSSR